MGESERLGTLFGSFLVNSTLSTGRINDVLGSLAGFVKEHLLGQGNGVSITYPPALCFQLNNSEIK